MRLLRRSVVRGFVPGLEALHEAQSLAVLSKRSTMTATVTKPRKWEQLSEG